MKITKTQIRRIIKEELSKVLNEANQDDKLMEMLDSAKVYKEIRGVYFTTTRAFLEAVRDMAAMAQETGDLEQSLIQIEADVDAGKYAAPEINKALRAGKMITRGVYATSQDSFLKAMTDAGEAAMEGMSPDEVVAKIEANVDAGKYRDPKVSAILKNLTRTGQAFRVGRQEQHYENH